jgi:hypothetical protein
LDTFCQNAFELVVGRHGTIDDRDSADRQTHVTVRVLRHEETRIERIELLHDSSPPFHCWDYVRVSAVTAGQWWRQD